MEAQAGVVGATVKGPSHVRSGMPNQDKIAWRQGSGSGGAVAVAVADGHGSPRSFRSHLGADFAVQLATGMLWAWVADAPAARSADDEAQTLRRLLPELTERWATKVRDHVARQPFEAAELQRASRMAGSEELVDPGHDPLVVYGATLLAVVVTAAAVHYLQLGDGDILAVWANGEVRRPLPVDRRLIANETTSLCLPEAWRQFRVGMHPLDEAPRLVLVSTDGYGNSFTSEREFFQVGSDLLPMVDRDGVKAIEGSLKGWLAETTEHGAGDDVTLAVVSLPFATALPPELPPVPVPAASVPPPATVPMPPSRLPATARATAVPSPPLEPAGGGPLVVSLNGQTYDVTGYRQVRIGRDPAADIRSSNKYVSQRHAVLRAEPTGWVLEDVGSRGGIYLDSQRMRRLAVTDPLRVWLGRPGQGDLLELAPDGRRVPTGRTTAGSRMPLLVGVGMLVLLAVLVFMLLKAFVGGGPSPATTPGSGPAANTRASSSSAAAATQPCPSSSPEEWEGALVQVPGPGQVVLGQRRAGPSLDRQQAIAEARASGPLNQDALSFKYKDSFYVFETAASNQAGPGGRQPPPCQLSVSDVQPVPNAQPAQPGSTSSADG
jgi:pSer/pThr/pTyr-binding forkhead associated (FHA) protein